MIIFITSTPFFPHTHTHTYISFFLSLSLSVYRIHTYTYTYTHTQPTTMLTRSNQPATNRKQNQGAKRKPGSSFLTPAAKRRRRVQSLHVDQPTPREDLHRPCSVLPMSEKEFAQRRKESARAVLDSILADLNASSTVKQYQNHIFKWKVGFSRSFYTLMSIILFSPAALNWMSMSNIHYISTCLHLTY